MPHGCRPPIVSLRCFIFFPSNLRSLFHQSYFCVRRNHYCFISPMKSEFYANSRKNIHFVFWNLFQKNDHQIAIHDLVRLFRICMSSQHCNRPYIDLIFYFRHFCISWFFDRIASKGGFWHVSESESALCHQRHGGQFLPSRRPPRPDYGLCLVPRRFTKVAVPQ